MSSPAAGSVPVVGPVTVRYWAAARAAAGVEADRLPVEAGTTLAEVLSVCSVLVGERPVGTADPAAVPVRAGDTVELLPPFAGG